MKFEDNTPHGPLDDVKLSHLFEKVLTPFAGKNTKVGNIVNALHERGFGVLLVLFTLPLSIPIPKIPPLDTILGIPLFYLCLQMILGRDTPRLPQKVLDYEISGDFLIKAFGKGKPWIEKFERLFKPRLTDKFSDHALSLICGSLGMLMTCSVLLPFPFSNTVPSICMLVMAMGIVCRDGLAALIAGLLGTTWVIGLTVVAFSAGEWLLSKV
ncbi:MAG: exopolysaccharide biosynthesis protein [Alphaproteobacteria bacterium]|nr:exopolysaccharide biosynthesis protein [Alphaproteobacteria bacterium]